MIGAFNAVLTIHIFSGVVALFVAPGAMITHKGGLWHRRWGKVYFWSMAIVALTAVVLSLLRPGVFLLLVAIFSFYLAFTGYSVLYRKTPRHRATLLDWVGTVLMLLGGIALLGLGAYLLTTSGFGLVPIVFASSSPMPAKTIGTNPKPEVVSR